MLHSRLLPIVLGISALLFSTIASLAADLDRSTPESVIAAYIDGVARRDFDAVLAATAADDMSKKFDFVNNINRLKTLSVYAPAPASDPFFVRINKEAFEAQTASAVKFLAYGLMTTSKVIEGNQVQMDAAGAEDFKSVVRADRLVELKLVKVGIPNPTVMNGEINQRNLARSAATYGADAQTERVALLSFEGLDFMVGFRLLRYGPNWGVAGQSSGLAGTNPLGAPTRVTPEAFEETLK
ncbi:hypothetical protein [Mesorhizobium sp.]|uniref:hypothetical protein n=1 Tax=Mesorhizobium sp. TaxID=1871066 RepID=UPI003BACC7C0